MFFKNPLDKKFSEWGKGKRAVPSNMSAMKEKFLATANVPVSQPLNIKPRRLYIGVLSAGLAVLLVFVGLKEYEKKGSIASMPLAYNTSYGGGIMPATSPEQYDESATLSDVDTRSGEAASLGQRYEDGNAVDSVENRVKSFTKEFVQPEYRQFASTPAVDDREFLKYTYNASLETREVEEVATKILTIIRGYKGRVDNARINDQYASVSFVVPKDDLLNFKEEIKSLVGKRFYEENLNLQNLLPEKVYIAESAETVNKNLTDFQTRLKELNDKHAKIIADLQRQVNGVVVRIAALRKEQATANPERQKQITAEIASLGTRQGSLNRQISEENKYYGWDKTSLEQDIKNTQTQLDNLSKQDTQLNEKVETVQGSINIQWISIPEMADIYVPYYWAWIIGLCGLALIVNFFTKRRRIEI